ncbi:hypothetical protein [Stackebrandtia soli]|uniref:hypothetical protein n=1 Tax=Stackebrandtia soli TaxID=1892856 RepID=UPI0039E8A1B0
MNLDRDVHRDEAAAFGPASCVEGAILPYEGRAQVRRSDGPWTEALARDEDGWLAPANPVLVRGQARILPLAWRGDPSNGRATGVEPEEIAEFAAQMEGSGYYWARSARTLDELSGHQGGSIASYLHALRAAGTTKATFWTISWTIGIALVWAGDENEGTMSLALHVVPASWVSETVTAKAVRGIDVGWSWADVIELYERRVGPRQDAGPGPRTNTDGERDGHR